MQQTQRSETRRILERKRGRRRDNKERKNGEVRGKEREES